MNTFQISALRQLGLSILLGVIHIIVLKKLKILHICRSSQLEVRKKLMPLQRGIRTAKDIQQLERVQRRATRFVKKKIIVIQLLSLVC